MMFFKYIKINDISKIALHAYSKTEASCHNNVKSL